MSTTAAELTPRGEDQIRISQSPEVLELEGEKGLVLLPGPVGAELPGGVGAELWDAVTWLSL